MVLNKLFPKKELNPKEEKEREYLLELKKLRRKAFKNPTRIMDLIEETEKLMDKAIIDGVMTQKEKDKNMVQLGKDMDKASRIIQKASFK